MINESKLYSDKFTEIITTTFEGAHHDHDSCAYISRKIGEALDIPLIEVATYPQKFQRIYSFQVLKPLFPAGSKIKFNRISVVKLAINLIWSYKTQRMTWMGLGILTIYNYLFKNFRVAIPQTVQHSTQCFYEFRGRAKQSDVLKKLR